MNIIKQIKSYIPESIHALSALYIQQVGLSLLVKVFSVLITLFYVPVVLGFLNQEKYGIWITLTTVVNWIRVLDIGMGNGMRNKLAESIALKEYEKGRIYISTTYGILGGIFLVVLIIFVLINPYLEWQLILNSTSIEVADLQKLTLIVVSFIIIGFILQPIVLIYDAHGQSVAGGVIQLIISALSFILVLAGTYLFEKGDIVLLGWIVTGIPILVYIVTTIYTFGYKFPHLRPSFKKIRISESGNLLRLSFQFFVLQITAMIVFSSIPFVVAHLFSPNEVTIYNITNTLFNVPAMVMSLIATPLLPLVTQAFAKKDYNWINSMLQKMNMVSLIMSIGVILLIFISPVIFNIWIGGKVRIPFDLSIAIGLYTVINIITVPFSIFINGIGKIRILVILAPFTIGVFIGLSIILSRILSNVIGVSIALSLSSLIGLIVTPFVLKKYNAIKFPLKPKLR